MVMVSLAYGEDDSFSFLTATLTTMLAGLLARFAGRNSDNNLSRRDAYLVVTAAWVIFSVFGMLPYLIGGYIPDVTNAYFETMSGFTTTGASILDDVEHLPHGILFWRTMTQWIGVFYGLIIENKLNRKVENLEKELDNFENMFFLKMHDMKHDSADSKKN